MEGESRRQFAFEELLFLLAVLESRAEPLCVDSPFPIHPSTFR